jgi:hypothetical protein
MTSTPMRTPAPRRRQQVTTPPTAAALLLVCGAVTGCAVERSAPAVDPPFPRQAIITELQEFQRSLGVERTGNFRRFSDAQNAVYRCYFTGQLELPASYEALQLVERDEPGCAVDGQAYDVFFYPIEAVASGSSPVSPALADASLERALVVVAHEDFHNQRETTQASFDIAEAAATLTGFITTRDFARIKYGKDSELFRRLDREAERFLVKAGIVNAYYRRLAGVYDGYGSGALTREEALARKSVLYRELERECQASEAAVSFNTCPAVMNNAGLAFDRTYTRHYPAWFELYESLDRDTGATVAVFKRVLATGPQSETELLDASTRSLRR